MPIAAPANAIASNPQPYITYYFKIKVDSVTLSNIVNFQSQSIYLPTVFTPIKNNSKIKRAKHNSQQEKHIQE